MIVNDVTYTCDIENMIIANLDGWVVAAPEPEPEPEPEVEDEVTVDQETETQTTTTSDDSTDTGIQPFMTSEELQVKANKVITRTECRLFYEEALDLAYLHTNRLNIEDLTSVEAKAFLRATCKWAASNLWNKYNIRVNNEDMEDTYVQSYGGLLYHSALKGLQPFINQRITAMKNISNNNDDDNDIWIV